MTFEGPKRDFRTSGSDLKQNDSSENENNVLRPKVTFQIERLCLTSEMTFKSRFKLFENV